MRHFIVKFRVGYTESVRDVHAESATASAIIEGMYRQNVVPRGTAVTILDVKEV